MNKCLHIIISALLCTATLYGQAVFKGFSTKDDNSGQPSITTPTALNIASGDLIIVLFTYQPRGVVAPTVTCGSNTLTQVKQNTESGGYLVFLFYKQNAVSGTTTCTGTTSDPGDTFITIVAANYSGVATSGALLASSCNSSGCNTIAPSSTNRTAQNVTTATTNTLLIGLGVDWNGGDTHTAANGYTLRVNSTTAFLLDKNVSSAGTYPSGNFSTTNVADQYLSLFAAFATTTSGGSTPKGRIWVE